MFKHILIPTDGSELSDKAVKRGAAFAKAVGAKITALNVVPSMLSIYYGGEMVWIDPKIDQELREGGRKAGGKYLDRVEATAKSAKVECERALVENDLVWQTIIDTAKIKDCDLIIMAAHGRRGLSALMLGSETHRVLVHSKIPVLVYR